MRRYICFLGLFCLCFLYATPCFSKDKNRKKLLRQYEKEERFLARQEYKIFKREQRAYEKEKRQVFKIQSPEVKARLRADQKRTKKFYKQYPKAKTNVTPGKRVKYKKNYRKDGIK